MQRVPRCFVIALAVAGCGGSTSTATNNNNPTGPSTSTISGTVASSLGGALSGVTVIVTPTGANALAATTTNANGTYSVSSVPVGGGQVAVSSVPSTCTAPAAKSYGGLTASAPLTVNMTVPCVGTGTVTGTISNSLGGNLAGVTVTITPQGQSALPSVTSNSSGVYTVTSVPTGSGSISVSNVGSACTAPAAKPYSGLTASGQATVNIPVTCTPSTPPPGLSLSVGQSTVFTDSAHMNTTLSLPSGSSFLVAVVNTDTAAAALEDFTLHGAVNPTASIVAHGPLARGRVRTARSSQGAVHKLPMRPISPSLARALALRAGTQRAHMAWLNTWDAVRAEAARSSRSGPIRKSTLGGTTVGQLNRIYVVRTSGAFSCNNVDSIWARTVYVGTHTLVLADTNTTTWPLANRPDSSYYTLFGSEFDAITFPHLQNYFGNPLANDAALSNVGKVTVVFTPLVNGGGEAGFVNSCDLYPTSIFPYSNATEVIYGWVPNPSAGVPVDFWGRDWRGTAAHEGKHVVSLGTHIADHAASFEQSWLEEAMAQQSAEIWERHFSLATWKGNAGFAQTIGCEYEPSSPCYNSANPIVLTLRHLPWYFNNLNVESTSPDSGGFSNTVDGKYGTAWAFIRWATDLFGGSTESTMLKALIADPTYTGMANVSVHTSQPVTQLLTYWSLASAFDSATLADSATFQPTDPRATMPSFDFRNIFSMGYSGATYQYFPAPYPVAPQSIGPVAFDVTVAGVPATGTQYFLLNGVSAAASEILELRSGSGGAISPSSGLRVGIIRIQ